MAMTLKDRMQITAVLIFVLAFGVVFVSAVDGIEKIPDYEVQANEAETTPTVKDGQAVFTTLSTGLKPLEEQEKQYIYYDIPLDDDLQEYIQDTCDKYGFDRYDIIIAIIQEESSYSEDVISSTYDYGYMQINQSNHQWLSEELGITDFLDGKQNILAGIYIYSDLYAKYDDVGLALMAYNCGETGAKNLWEQEIYSTQYSRAVIEIAEKLTQKQ
jgi:hypothetical protein